MERPPVSDALNPSPQPLPADFLLALQCLAAEAGLPPYAAAMVAAVAEISNMTGVKFVSDAEAWGMRTAAACQERPELVLRVLACLRQPGMGLAGRLAARMPIDAGAHAVNLGSAGLSPTNPPPGGA